MSASTVSRPGRALRKARLALCTASGLACLGLGTGPAASAQPVPADSVAAPTSASAESPDPTGRRVRGAVLRSLAVPGWGQLYNGEAYKAPFALGLVVGAGATGVAQQRQYLLYSRAAFYSVCVGTPERESCEGFESRREAWTEAGGDRVPTSQYQQRRDSARGARDLAFAAVVGVYALQVLDAYVAAQLSDFDVSEDVTLSVAPRLGGAGLSLRARF